MDAYATFPILISGNNAEKVAALFRAVGYHRLDHIFTVAILHGVCANLHDPKCKIMSLYPVNSARRYAFSSGKPQVRRQEKVKFSRGMGHFCKIEFPRTFQSFEQEVNNESMVKELLAQSEGKLNRPTYQDNYPLEVCYTAAKQSQVSKLRKKLRIEDQSAANLDGCLLKFIARPRVAVILAINGTLKNDTLDKDIQELFGSVWRDVRNSLKNKFKRMVRRTITHFVRAVVVAGLPKGEIIKFQLSHFLY